MEAYHRSTFIVSISIDATSRFSGIVSPIASWTLCGCEGEPMRSFCSQVLSLSEELYRMPLPFAGSIVRWPAK